MIKIQTIVKIMDNSGGIFAMCLRTMRNSFRVGALPGHQIKVTIKKSRKRKKVLKKYKDIKKGGLYLAVVVCNIRGVKR